MATILGKKIGLENIIGEDNSTTPPESWEYLAHKTDSGTWDWTWTAPKAGWYSFHIVGDGGSGGNGGASWAEAEYDGSWRTGSGGGGGGHGAYAVHTVFLQRGKDITFVKSGTAITAAILDANIVVEHGKAGGAGSGTNNTPGPGGKTAAATGANSANIAGGRGTSGRQGNSGHGVSATNDELSSSKQGGNGGGISPAMKYSNGIPNNSRTAAADYTKANLGNAGNGGNSGSVSYYNSMPHTEASATPGYPGIPGGVVIDRAAS